MTRIGFIFEFLAGGGHWALAGGGGGGGTAPKCPPRGYGPVQYSKIQIDSGTKKWSVKNIKIRTADPTRPDPPKSGKIVTRPDPRVHPTRGQLWAHRELSVSHHLQPRTLSDFALVTQTSLSSKTPGRKYTSQLKACDNSLSPHLFIYLFIKIHHMQHN